MNLANTLTVLFCLMSAGMTYWIFQSTWYTTLGTRKPVRKLDWRAALLGIPLCLGLLGTWSILLDSDWTNPIQLMPKAVGLSVLITFGLSLLKWFRAPNPMDVTLKSFLTRHFKQLRDFDLGEELADELTQTYGAAHVFHIRDTGLLTLVFIYFDYLRSIEHEVKKESFFSEKTGTVEVFRFVSESGGDSFNHLVVYSAPISFAGFREDMVET